ncbi:MAG: thioredoxin family protein [Magnetococcales bacterium]|nr:thioredoxin family protein [Magnetococcales bacterium]MBF0156655.1 thioredoxin family protein [Magnetococcales bacterium]
MGGSQEGRPHPAETLARIVTEGSRDKLIFLAFMTQTCPGCKETYEALKKFSSAHGQAVEVVVVDADRHPSISLAYQVRGVPTLVVYGRQRPLFTETGPKSKRNLEKMFKMARSMLPGS